MLDLIFAHAVIPTEDRALREQLTAQVKAVTATEGKGDRGQVERAEEAVQADPTRAFTFDATGAASLTANGATWSAGRFETPSLRELRERVSRAATSGATGRLRLCVLNGANPVTDIGSLQASCGRHTLFQVASQFNCLESPGPYVTPVAEYFHDPTQGPRAAISAFPGTLLRHYAAPGPAGRRFVQETDKLQIDLLADACGYGVVRNGYLTGAGVADRPALAAALETNFDAIRVGVHDDVAVVLGYDWDGGVATTDSRIAQVFTSTVAGGAYGGASALGRETFAEVCQRLLRAAYLGTLLAAVSLGQTRVVLTLIGGGAFKNPMPLIWTAIEWALDEVAPILPHDLDVVVNGRNLPMSMRWAILAAVKRRQGAYLTFTPKGLDTIQR